MPDLISRAGKDYSVDLGPGFGQNPRPARLHLDDIQRGSPWLTWDASVSRALPGYPASLVDFSETWPSFSVYEDNGTSMNPHGTSSDKPWESASGEFLRVVMSIRGGHPGKRCHGSRDCSARSEETSTRTIPDMDTVLFSAKDLMAACNPCESATNADPDVSPGRDRIFFTFGDVLDAWSAFVSTEPEGYKTCPGRKGNEKGCVREHVLPDPVRLVERWRLSESKEDESVKSLLKILVKHRIGTLEGVTPQGDSIEDAEFSRLVGILILSRGKRVGNKTAKNKKGPRSQGNLGSSSVQPALYSAARERLLADPRFIAWLENSSRKPPSKDDDEAHSDNSGINDSPQGHGGCLNDDSDDGMEGNGNRGGGDKDDDEKNGEDGESEEDESENGSRLEDPSEDVKDAAAQGADQKTAVLIMRNPKMSIKDQRKARRKARRTWKKSKVGRKARRRWRRGKQRKG